jgi:glutamine synthetase
MPLDSTHEVPLQAPQRAIPDFVVQRAHERNVGAIELWVTEPGGSLQVLQVPREALPEVLEDGYLAGAELGPMLAPRERRMTRVAPEVYLVPDPMTFQVVPRPGSGRSLARLICDVQLPDGSPSPLCVRSSLKAVLGKVASEAVTFYAGARLSHRWLAEPRRPSPLLDPRRQQALADQTASLLDQLAIPWRSHGAAPSAGGGHDEDPSRWVFELDGVDPLTLSDGIVTLRRLALLTAHADGCGATWMPHPWPGATRASLELSLSRASPIEGGTSAFCDLLHPSGLSILGRAVSHAIAAEIPALSLVLRGTANSYTRPDPVEVVAAPMSRSEAGAAISLRGADACTNPYAALGLVIAIAHEAALAPHTAPPEPPARPQTLVEAARIAQSSSPMQAVLGSEMLDGLVARANADAARWRSQVTAFEVERYL